MKKRTWHNGQTNYDRLVLRLVYFPSSRFMISPKRQCNWQTRTGRSSRPSLTRNRLPGRARPCYSLMYIFNHKGANSLAYTQPRKSRHTRKKHVFPNVNAAPRGGSRHSPCKKVVPACKRDDLWMFLVRSPRHSSHVFKTIFLHVNATS